MSAPLPRRSTLVPLLLLLALVLTGCSDESDPGTPDGAPTTASTPQPAKAAPSPSRRACYRLDYATALEPTTAARPVRCGRPHTVRTMYVGRSAPVVKGHLLAVDSEHVRRQVLTTCPQRFARYVGGTSDQRRLSMLSPVWFGPTLEESDAGEAWFRCDLVALAGPERLARLGRSMRGVLDSPAGRARWGRCATAKPGSPGAKHVLCAVNDAWRAVATVDVPAGPKGAWPGRKQAARAGIRCEDLVRRIAADPLKFTWGYEPPDPRQWAAGRRYGFCWAPG